MTDSNENAAGGFASLLPELAAWNDGEGIEVREWLSCIGSYEHAIGYAALFWPSFVLHDECVLFEGFRVSSYDGFFAQTKGKRRSVEGVMNHRHVLDMFPNSEREPTRAQVVHLGRTLKAMWSAKLRSEHPTRNVVVTFVEEGIEDLLDYQITFFQEPPSQVAR